MHMKCIQLARFAALNKTRRFAQVNDTANWSFLFYRIFHYKLFDIKLFIRKKNKQISKKIIEEKIVLLKEKSQILFECSV